MCGEKGVKDTVGTDRDASGVEAGECGTEGLRRKVAKGMYGGFCVVINTHVPLTAVRTDIQKSAVPKTVSASNTSSLDACVTVAEEKCRLNSSGRTCC